MLKKGFTLIELIVTLVVVGVIAAICIPAISNIIPDKKKAIYVKAYSTLSKLTEEILDDPTLYWTTYDTNGDASCTMLDCTSTNDDMREIYTNLSTPSDANKFPKIFAKKLNLSEDYNNNEFTTVDGVKWSFVVNGDSSMDITIDVAADNNEDDCTYSTAACSDPDLFTFKIDKEGGIRAIDALGRAYLENLTEMNSKNADKKRADEIYKSSTINNGSSATIKPTSPNTGLNKQPSF